MMKLRNLLTNVWLISLVPFIIISLFVKMDLNKYSLELFRTDIVNSGQYIYYEDLDNDGISERIVAFDQFNSSGISISSREGIIDQWNFKGSFTFAPQKSIFIAGDKNNDGLKEIYAFTRLNDSIFLHCIGDLHNPRLSFQNRFLAVTGKGIKNPDPYILEGNMEDLDSDGVRELIFGIGTGFSIYPRKIYAYNIEKDSLTGSPDASYFIEGIKQADVNGDGFDEFLPWGYAAENVKPGEAKYHDCSSYLFAIDRKMKFAFEPVEFSGRYSHLYPFIRVTEKGNQLAGLYSPSLKKLGSVVYNFSPQGDITDSLRLNFFCYSIEPAGENFLVPSAQMITGDKFIEDQNYVALVDKSFKVLKSIPFKSAGYKFLDIDGDGKDEYIFQNIDDGRLYIFREGLSQPVSEKITIASGGWDILTLRKGYGPYPSISLQSGQNHFILNYSKNRNHIYSYFFYPGVYFSVLAFALLVRSVQRNQMRKRYENEKKISELQMALIRNQLDPHFTLNAINSIIYSVNYGDRNDAADSLRCFAGMYRDMVLSAGSSRRSLEDEITFCRNYLSLEKVRFGEKFVYTIDIDDRVNLQRLIPKFLIQIHAENAIKHGLSLLERRGELKIIIRENAGDLLIEITDNGIGREKAARESENSTKKGLEIMKELYNLYNRFYNERINSEIIDLYDEKGEPAGTSVRISIITQTVPERNIN